VDLRGGLEDADRQPDDQHGQQHGRGDHQQQVQALLPGGEDLLCVHRG
jgi:hypothetical protein